MARLERPLDRQAVKAADDKLYDQHRNDPRPNALFDANGNRRPLDPQDPSQAALRREWVASYNESLRSRQPAAAVAAEETTSSTERPVRGVAEPCPRKHWIYIVVRPKPDLRPRPAYWPPAGRNPYGLEVFSAQTTDGPREGQLDSGAGVRFDNIPQGSCQIKLPRFFDGIGHHVKRELDKFA